MKDGAARLATLTDDALPAMPAMLGREAVDLLGAASGRRLASARPIQVTWHPGRSLAVCYEVRSGTGRRTSTARLVGYTGRGLPSSAIQVRSCDQRVAVWPLADDPWLPGLRPALNAVGARRLLDELGAGAGEVRSRLRSYRPGRRAVVELAVGGTAIFAKIVRPDEAPALHLRHQAMAECLPVPRSHGWSAEHGIVMLERMRGVMLREALSDTRLALPDDMDLAALLDRIPDPPDGRRQRDLLEQAPAHVRLLAALLPDVAPRLDRLLHSFTSTGPPGPIAPVHGDFYEGQILVADGRITGLLDVDTAACGYRACDWATLIGHLAVLARRQPPRIRARTSEYAYRLLGFARREVDPASLRTRIAAVILGLATGPFRTQSPSWPTEIREHIGLAERWLANGCADERHLMAISGPTHVRASA